MASKSDDSEIRIVDFGLATTVNGDNQRDQCGTPYYMAPEIILGSLYGKSVDMWAFGVILYTLLSGNLPFDGWYIEELFRKIIAGKFEFPLIEWKSISATAKDLISCLLTVDVKKRLTVDQALSHAWLSVKDEVLAARDLSKTVTYLKQLDAAKAKKLKTEIKVSSGDSEDLLSGPTGDQALPISQQPTVRFSNVTLTGKALESMKPKIPLPATVDIKGNQRITKNQVTKVLETMQEKKEHLTIPSNLPHILANYYLLGKKLGEGAFGLVKIGLNKFTKEEVAVKIYYLSKLPDILAKGLNEEMAIMKDLNDHPNIVQFYDYFKEKEACYVIMEKISGGELFDRITRKDHYSEKEAQAFSKILFQTIKFMHDKNIVHR
jgi:serine/threonine protein kinase